MPSRLRISCLALLVLSGAVRADGGPRADVAGFERVVAPFFAAHCNGCHGADVQEGKLSLQDVDPDLLNGEDLETWRFVRERLRFGEMPPEGEAQPSKAERERVLSWIRGELRKTQLPATATDPKLLLPDYGNYVDHAALFEERAERVVPVSPRLWRIRPGIYERLSNRITEGLEGTSQPFSVRPGTGFKDFAAAYFVDEPTTDLLLRNAELIVEAQVPHGRYGDIKRLVDAEQPPSEEIVEGAIRREFAMALRREPTEEELRRFKKLHEKNVATSGHVIGGKATLMAVLMQPEVVFRLELGQGETDAHGRRRLSQREIAKAVSYALSDDLDGQLFGAAEQGELATSAQVAAHVRRILEEERHERVMDFFREFFGYREATNVFKDPPERGLHDAGRLVNDLEYTIGAVVERDEEVLRELLTTNRYFVNYKVDQNKEGRITKAHHKGTWYQTAYGLPPDWKWTAEQPVELPPEQYSGVLTHPAWLVAWSGNFDNHPVQRGKWVRTHLLGGSVPDVPIGVDARIPDHAEKTLRERLQTATGQTECWRCHRKMDPLGLPFEQFDHYGRRRRRELDRPVETSGAVTLTGVPEIEGPVADPVQMLHRLAKSEHVEQVFVRHAFRFFLGRNETLGDAKTLQEAHAAYREQGGSFDALIVALLSSDSFLYRADHEQSETPRRQD